ncbi:unnamed protein product, partial [Rotaria magnacalcarata]
LTASESRWLLWDNNNWDVSQVRCNSVINLASKHVSWNPRKTDNDDVRLSDSANEEVKDPDEDDQEMREQLYQDLDAEMNDDQTSTLDIPESSNSDDSQEQYVSSTTNISSVTTAAIVKHRRVKRVYMLRTSPYGLRKRNGMRLLELWFDTQYRNQPWSLISIIGLIDLSLSIHKFPSTICRTPRIFLKYTDFEAGELRCTLLFVLTSFSMYLPHKYCRHLLLLVVLVHRCESKSTFSD